MKECPVGENPNMPTSRDKADEGARFTGFPVGGSRMTTSSLPHPDKRPAFLRFARPSEARIDGAHLEDER